MISKQPLVQQMDALLKQINEQFDQLTQENAQPSLIEVGLFEATVQYFAAHVRAFHQLSAPEPILIETERVYSAPPAQEDAAPVVMTSEFLNEPLSSTNVEQDEDLETVSADEEVYTLESDDIFPDEGEHEFSDLEDTTTDEDTSTYAAFEEEPEVAPKQEEESRSSSYFTPFDTSFDTSMDAGKEAEDDFVADNQDFLNEEERMTEEEIMTEEENIPEEKNIFDEDVVAEENLLDKKEIAEESFTAPSIPFEDKNIREMPEAPARPMSINERLALQMKEASAQSSTSEASKNIFEEPVEKVKDIRMIISLNDKLLFIKDLFNGYSLAYSEAMELLNRYDSFDEAHAFLESNYAIKNQWQEKPATTEKLYSLMRKRFH